MTTQEILQLAQGARLPLALADTHTKMKRWKRWRLR